MSMSTGTSSELSAEEEVRSFGEWRSLVITMSRTSEEADGLYGFVVRLSGPNIRQELLSA